MTSVIAYSLIGDGTSDAALLPILAWSLRRLAPHRSFAPQPFFNRGSKDIDTTLDIVLTKYRPDLLFVHRDAERFPLQTRRAEIPTAEHIVPVVPVRMTEAWLLIDIKAIRVASGNPNGKVDLELPRPKTLERMPDPKREMERLLLDAAGALGPRRRKSFRQEQAAMVHRVAESIEDFSPLLQLEAFSAFWIDLQQALARLESTKEPTIE